MKEVRNMYTCIDTYSILLVSADWKLFINDYSLEIDRLVMLPQSVRFQSSYPVGDPIESPLNYPDWSSEWISSAPLDKVGIVT
jgi:hypothetical protein